MAISDHINFIDDSVLSSAPAEEPARQLYFIRCLQALFSSGTAVSRTPTAAIITFGCQMNARDSEKLDGILRELGFDITGNELDADLVLFNTCTVRENANEHLYGRLGRLKNAKKEQPERIIGVCGCMMQEADEVEKLRVRYPYVDLIFGTHNLYKFPELLFLLQRKRAGFIDRLEEASAGNVILTDSTADADRYEKLLRYGSGTAVCKEKTISSKNAKDLVKLSRRPLISVWKDSSDIVEDLPQHRKYPFKQGINIMFGCNNFCSYCIVPYVRGREKSRTPEEILREIRSAASDGVKEIMLLGQNVNSYHGSIRFPELLKRVDALADETGIERIRFMTSHPKDLSDRVIEAMAQGRHLCEHIHLPVQHGSSKILKAMNRVYTAEAYKDLVKRIRAALPEVSLTTDLIVGFPGETDEDFEELLAFLKEIRYDAAYTFIYSKRSGTPAAEMEDQVPEDVKKARLQRLMEVQNEISLEINQSMLGKTLEVMVEGPSKNDENVWMGHTRSNKIVLFPHGQEKEGDFVQVKITSPQTWVLKGEVC